MKSSNLKTILIAAIAATGFTAASAMAAPTADTFLKAFETRNSSDQSELALFEQVSGLDLDKEDLVRDESPGLRFDADSALWILNDTPAEAGYFLLKFGLGQNGGFKTSFDSYLFKNTGDLTQLVFSARDVNYLIGGDCSTKNDNACNATRLSHWTFIAGDGVGGPGGGTGGEVPEPASLALLAAGLAGMALRRRR